MKRILLIEDDPDIVVLVRYELAETRQDPLLQRLPVIMLSARCGGDDLVAAFETGADDYVTKPFSPRELLARSKLLLWRAEPHAEFEQVLQFDYLRINLDTNLISCFDKAIPTSLLEFRLLYQLASHPRRVSRTRRTSRHRLGRRTLCHSALRGCLRPPPERKKSKPIPKIHAS